MFLNGVSSLILEEEVAAISHQVFKHA
jgi:hypothetical protein